MNYMNTKTTIQADHELIGQLKNVQLRKWEKGYGKISYCDIIKEAIKDMKVD